MKTLVEGAVWRMTEQVEGMELEQNRFCIVVDTKVDSDQNGDGDIEVLYSTGMTSVVKSRRFLYRHRFMKHTVLKVTDQNKLSMVRCLQVMEDLDRKGELHPDDQF